MKYLNDVIGVTDVQLVLPDDQTQLLEYYLTDSLIYIFSLSRNEFDVKRIRPEEGFFDRLSQFNHDLRNPQLADQKGNDPTTFHEFSKDAHVLYTHLLEPVLKQNEGGKKEALIIVPDGTLGYLPFEILLKNELESGQSTDYTALPYVFKNHRIRYAYSSGLMLEEPLKEESPRMKYAGFAPVYQGDFLATARDAAPGSGDYLGYLYGNQPEVEAISTLVGGDPYLGEAATESNFKARAAAYRIPSSWPCMHLPMMKRPLYSGLVFSEEQLGDSMNKKMLGENDGYLHAYEIYNLSLNADLAVLSACNTGTGTLTRGEGIMSLARAFRYAGCPNIVMSLWQADDQATREIMEGFYAYLKAGSLKDEALRRARMDFLEKTSLKHPHYWAPFVLMGDDQPIAFQGNAGGWVLWIGLLALAALLGGFVWNKRKKSF